MATTWVFQREDECLRVQRQDVLGELGLVVWGTGVADRVRVFDDEAQLAACMAALDSHLVAAGWSLIDFFPERRSSARPGPASADRRLPASPRYTHPSNARAGDEPEDAVRA